MKDMLDIIHQAMQEDEVIASNCEGRIKYYLYPETGETVNPFITIRPLTPPEAKVYASDKNLSYQFFYQIDVQASERKKCKEIQHAVKAVMEGIGYVQQAGGLDEYFQETKRFVDARRYIKTTDLYDTDY